MIRDEVFLFEYGARRESLQPLGNETFEERLAKRGAEDGSDSVVGSLGNDARWRRTLWFAPTNIINP